MYAILSLIKTRFLHFHFSRGAKLFSRVQTQKRLAVLPISVFNKCESKEKLSYGVLLCVIADTVALTCVIADSLECQVLMCEASVQCVLCFTALLFADCVIPFLFENCS